MVCCIALGNFYTTLHVFTSQTSPTSSIHPCCLLLYFPSECQGLLYARRDSHNLQQVILHLIQYLLIKYVALTWCQVVIMVGQQNRKMMPIHILVPYFQPWPSRSLVVCGFISLKGKPPWSRVMSSSPFPPPTLCVKNIQVQVMFSFV